MNRPHTERRVFLLPPEASHSISSPDTLSLWLFLPFSSVPIPLFYLDQAPTSQRIEPSLVLADTGTRCLDSWENEHMLVPV